MSQQEKKLWQTVRRLITTNAKPKSRCHLTRIENALGVGTPDVAYAINGHVGWIELKVVPTKPSEDAPFAPTHFTMAQAYWLMRHRSCGGNAWLLLQINDEYILLDGTMAYVSWLGQKPYKLWRAWATAKWEKKIDGKELVAALCS